MSTGNGAPFRPPPRREQVQAVLLAALCAVLFLGQALLPGRAVVPFAPELLEPLRSEALAEGRVAAEDLAAGNLGMGDKYNQSLAWDRITADRLAAGEWPLWTRDIGGGAAFVPQMGQVYQPWNLLLLAIPSTQVYGLWYFAHLVLFGWLAYRFLRRIGLQHAAGCFGLVCVVLGLWTQARVHHNVMLTAALPFFGVLSCVHQLFVHRGGIGTAGLLALGTGLSWLGGMPYLSLLASLTAVAYATTLAIGAPAGARLRPSAWLAVGLLTGGLLGLAQIGPVLFAASDTARSTPNLAALALRSLDFAHLWSALWTDVFVWPDDAFYASGEQRMSWPALLFLDRARTVANADSFAETAFAIGIPATACALAGLAHHRRRAVLFWLILALLAYLVAAGVGPLLAAVRLLPGAATGDVRRWLFLFAMGLAVLAAFGFDRWSTRGLPVAAIACALVALASAALWFVHSGDPAAVENLYAGLAERREGIPADAFRAATLRGEAEANRAHLCATFGRGLLFALLGGAFLALRRWRLAPLALIATVAVELAVAGHGTIVPVAAQRVSEPPKILAPALRATRAATGPRPRFQRLVQPDDKRLAPLLIPNLGAFYGLEDLAAYNPLPPRRFEEFWAAIGGPRVAVGGAGVVALRDPATLAHPLLDVLGLEWVLTDRPLPDRLLAAGSGLEDRTPAATAAPHRLYRRTTCLPRATFVAQVRVEPDRAARLAALANPERAAARELILEDDEAPMPKDPTGAADVQILSHADQLVNLRVRNATAGYLRLADPWDPGWTAQVDGASTEVYVADHYLRAIWLEPGQHDVTFAYDGARVTLPRVAALVGLLATLMLCLGGVLASRGGMR